MYKKIIDYTAAGDVLGAIKQCFRRFSIDKMVLVYIEVQYLENNIDEKNLVFNNGKQAIRITDISDSDMGKIEKIFTTIESPCKYVEEKWYFINEDPMYVKDIIFRIDEYFYNLI